MRQARRGGMTWRLAAVATVIAAVAILVAAALVRDARAHDAPSGWSYPWSCCSGQDCRAVSSAWVKAMPEGWQLPTGEIVGYSDSRIKPSPDGDYHWCSVAGSDTTGTICLFVPPQSF